MVVKAFCQIEAYIWQEGANLRYTHLFLIVALSFGPIIHFGITNYYQGLDVDIQELILGGYRMA